MKHIYIFYRSINKYYSPDFDKYHPKEIKGFNKISGYSFEINDFILFCITSTELQVDFANPSDTNIEISTLISKSESNDIEKLLLYHKGVNIKVLPDKVTFYNVKVGRSAKKVIDTFSGGISTIVSEVLNSAGAFCNSKDLYATLTSIWKHYFEEPIDKS